MIEKGLYSALAQNVTIGSRVVDRIFPVEIAKGALMPVIAYQGVASSAIATLEGRNQLQTRRFQFDVYSDDYFESRTLSTVVKQLLVPSGDVRPDNFYPFTLPDGTLVTGSQLHIDSDFPPEPGVEGVVYRALLDIELTFVEAT